MHLRTKRNVRALHVSFYFTALALVLVTMVMRALLSNPWWVPEAGIWKKLKIMAGFLQLNETSVFVMMEDLFFSKLFFPSRGQIAIFDRKTNQFKLLPGASQPNMVQASPEWSPDGKTLTFAAVRLFRFSSNELAAMVPEFISLNSNML
jgi:hypothetical protein